MHVFTGRLKGSRSRARRSGSFCAGAHAGTLAATPPAWRKRVDAWPAEMREKVRESAGVRRIRLGTSLPCVGAGRRAFGQRFELQLKRAVPGEHDAAATRSTGAIRDWTRTWTREGKWGSGHSSIARLRMGRCSSTGAGSWEDHEGISSHEIRGKDRRGWLR
jgi:hypothetical protein